MQEFNKKVISPVPQSLMSREGGKKDKDDKHEMCYFPLFAYGCFVKKLLD
jgi:hypothetical protein